MPSSTLERAEKKALSLRNVAEQMKWTEHYWTLNIKQDEELQDINVLNGSKPGTSSRGEAPWVPKKRMALSAAAGHWYIVRSDLRAPGQGGGGGLVLRSRRLHSPGCTQSRGHQPSKPCAHGAATAQSVLFRSPPAFQWGAPPARIWTALTRKPAWGDGAEHEASSGLKH